MVPPLKVWDFHHDPPQWLRWFPEAGKLGKLQKMAMNLSGEAFKVRHGGNTHIINQHIQIDR